MGTLSSQLLKMAQKALREIRAMGASLFAIQKQTEAIQQDIERQNKQEQTPIPITVRSELEVPERVERQRQASDDRQYRLQRLLTLGTWGAFIAASLYAYVATRQWKEMMVTSDAASDTAHQARRALVQARDQFRQDQRPYVWMTANLGSPMWITNTGQVVWDLHYTNYGKSPALGIKAYLYIRVGKRGIQPSLGPALPWGASPLPIGKDDFFSIVSKTKITQDEFNRLLSWDHPETGFIEISGRFVYGDSYGGNYESGFCLRKLKTGAIEYHTQENNYIR